MANGLMNKKNSKASSLQEKVKQKAEDKLRQEGREEVLEWLRQYEIVSYSIPENTYFIFDQKSQNILVLPWKRTDVG
jgi:hypothetical protein